MKQSIRLWSMSVPVFSCLILSSCAGVPPHNLSLDQAKSEYAYASQNAYVKQAAPEQLQKAADAIDRSEALLNKGAPESDVEHYAYLAKQRVAIANQKAKTDAIQQKIKLAGSRRDKMMLESGQQKIDLLSGEVAKQKADAAASQEKERLAKSEQDKSVLEGKQQKIDMLSKQISDLKIQRTSRGLVLTLGSVLFDLNKASLKEGARKNIAKIAKFMNDNSKRNVMIEGYTDSTGRSDFNKRLSRRRADAVRDALVSDGVNPQRIVRKGYGSDYAVATNKTAAGRQRNRRVEIVFSGANGSFPENR